jgi:hypothetical protein
MPLKLSNSNWLRWLGRIVGTTTVVFWLVVGLLSATLRGDPWTAETSLLTALIVAAAASMALAWPHPLLGGTLCMMVGVLFGVFAYVTSGHNHWLAVLISGVPLLVAGALLVWDARRRSHVPNGGSVA